MSLPSGASTTAAPAARRRRITDALTWLGGADREILRLAPSGRSHFVQMGLTVLATASIAVLSMTFALINGLKLSVGLAVFGGIVWGCIIAMVDRFLVTSLSMRGGLRRVLVIVGVRLIIAALLGVIISTPLVLHIFQREIQAQISLSTVNSDKTFGNSLNTGPIAAQLNQVKARVAADQAALQGHIPAVDTPDVQSRQQYLNQAQATFTQLQSVSEQKYRAWQCELYGSSCEGSTDVRGNGTLAQARQQEYLTAKAQTDAAQQVVEKDQAALTQAQNAAVAQSGNALQLAQARATQELPALLQREKSLQTQYDDEADKGNSNTLGDNGLLAQIQALGQLGDQSSAARLTHYAVAALFFMIELLPVLVKILTSAGPASAYERVREMAENADVDNAKIEHRRRTRQRDEEENRTAANAKSRSDVEDDMRIRERDLSIKANERVAKEMEKVLDVALAKWAQQVQNTLYGQSPTNGAPIHNGSSTLNAATVPFRPVNGVGHGPAAGPVTPPPAGSPTGQPTGSPPPPQVNQNVRSNFNLPPTHKLTPSNGGTP